jgi:glycosyltransferase involved in cell wall biosynthesis
MLSPEKMSARRNRAESDEGASADDDLIAIAFVVDNLRLGGTELNAVRTAERLDRERFRLTVFCLGTHGPLSARYQAIGVPVVTLELRGWVGLSMLSSGWRFVRYLRRERIQIVHAHDMYSNIFVAVWAWCGGVRAVIASRRWGHQLPNNRLQWGNRLAFKSASAVLANSPQVAKSLIEEGRVVASKVWTVTNFANDEAFGVPTPEERARIRRKWDVPEQAIVIGCVARLSPVKNHDVLLEAFAKLRAAHSEVMLVIIGDGDARASLETLTRTLEIKASVRFLGELPEGTNHHRAWDIAVLASRSEGFPNTLVEAMAAAKPVVATAVGGNVDAVIDGVTGFLVPPDDAEELANALARLVNDGELRRMLGDAGLQRAQESYRASSVLQTIQAMYKHLSKR